MEHTRSFTTMFGQTSRRLGAALLLTLLPATASLAASDREVDARFDAGWRPTKAQCAFGGQTAKLAAYCADLNFGREGLEVVARAVNEQVLASAGGEKLLCTEHVAQVRERMAEYADYEVREIYSCDANPPVEDGCSVCHVSLLVTSASGARVVIDNGHVLDPASTGGVGSYTQFAGLVDHHWTGETPDHVALGSR
jgi:hypothetical protein